MTTVHALTPELQVNEIIHRFPGTLPVFHAAGIDSCCGGALPVGEAARRHGLDADQLMADLRSAAGETAD